MSLPKPKKAQIGAVISSTYWEVKVFYLQTGHTHSEFGSVLKCMYLISECALEYIPYQQTRYTANKGLTNYSFIEYIPNFLMLAIFSNSGTLITLITAQLFV